jgi:hypothetical protein
VGRVSGSDVGCGATTLFEKQKSKGSKKQKRQKVQKQQRLVMILMRFTIEVVRHYGSGATFELGGRVAHMDPAVYLGATLGACSCLLQRKKAFNWDPSQPTSMEEDSTGK